MTREAEKTSPEWRGEFLSLIYPPISKAIAQFNICLTHSTR